MRKIAILVTLGMLLLCGCEKKMQEETKEERSLVSKVEFEGKEMEYIRFGNEEGRKLVILPGLSLKSVMGSATAIEGAYALAAKDHEVFLLDHIRNEPENYRIEDMAKDTITVLKKLGLDHFDLMGVSMGGMVSQLIAMQEPAMVDHLVLCSTTADVKSLDQDVFENWKKLAEERDLNGLMASFGEKVYSPSFYAQYKDAIIASGEGTEEKDYVNFLRSLEAIRDFDVKKELSSITCPVLVLGAGEDQVVGVQSSLDLSKILACECYIYEGYGHGVYDEAPDYLSRILDFIEK